MVIIKRAVKKNIYTILLSKKNEVKNKNVLWLGYNNSYYNYNNANEYVKHHIFELLRKIWICDWSLQLHTQLKQLSCAIKAWKQFRPELDSNPWPLRYRCSALLTELSSQWWKPLPPGLWPLRHPHPLPAARVPTAFLSSP